MLLYYLEFQDKGFTHLDRSFVFVHVSTTTFASIVAILVLSYFITVMLLPKHIYYDFYAQNEKTSGT